jgi:hypothetical protein
MKVSRHWQNNFAGIFWVSLIFVAIIVAINSALPSAASRYVLTLFLLIGAVSLGGWTWQSFKLAGDVKGKLLSSGGFSKDR